MLKLLEQVFSRRAAETRRCFLFLATWRPGGESLCASVSLRAYFSMAAAGHETGRQLRHSARAEAACSKLADAFHHVGHLAVHLDELVDVGDFDTCAGGDALAPRAV